MKTQIAFCGLAILTLDISFQRAKNFLSMLPSPIYVHSPSNELSIAKDQRYAHSKPIRCNLDFTSSSLPFDSGTN